MVKSILLVVGIAILIFLSVVAVTCSMLSSQISREEEMQSLQDYIDGDIQ